MTTTTDTFPSTHEDRTDIYIVQAALPCPKHKTRHLVTVPTEGLRRYNRNEGYIQDPDIFGCLSADRRETIMSGFCPEAYEALVAEIEADEAWDTKE